MTSIDTTNKPFMIEKRQVYEAYKAVKSNKGAAGVDGQTIEQFEADLGGNLYKIWNRMSSGSYFPPPVRAVTIPKKSGGERILGVPTVGDRLAQRLVKQLIEPDLDPISCQTLTATDRENRLWVRLGSRESGAGNTIGC
jgi:retron-type reverse transcriptase